MVAILTFFIVILDQLTKFIISYYYNLLPIDIIKGIFSINLVRNRGAAFGILENQTIFFIIIAVTAIILILLMLWKSSRRLSLSGIASGRNLPNSIKISFSLILGGAIGNLIDRVRFGYVVDFLDFKIWPVFNIADSAITVGTILLLSYLILNRKKT